MKTELDGKIEITRLMHGYAYAIRRGKKNPELARFAAEREMQFKAELDELQREKALTEQPALALVSAE